MSSTRLTIDLNSVKNIKKFVEITQRISNIIDAEQGRFNVNAKSLLGLYSLDLEKPVTLVVYGEVEKSTMYMLENFNEV